MVARGVVAAGLQTQALAGVPWRHGRTLWVGRASDWVNG